MRCKGKRDLEGVVEEIGRKRNERSGITYVVVVNLTKSFVEELECNEAWCTVPGWSMGLECVFHELYAATD